MFVYKLTVSLMIGSNMVSLDPTESVDTSPEKSERIPWARGCMGSGQLNPHSARWQRHMDSVAIEGYKMIWESDLRRELVKPT